MLINRQIVWIVLCGCVAAFPASSAEMPKVEPGVVGLSGAKLAGLKPELQKIVEGGKIAGGVALIARHGQVAYLEPFGYRDLATKAPMTDDTIFAIASMTKPITCVALMTLVEQGKVALSDPLWKYLPEWKDVRVLGDAKDDKPGELATLPSARAITVRDLLTHTSGIAYGGVLSADARLGKAYDALGVQDRTLKTIEEQIRRLAKAPILHQPGERWTYGLNHDVVGRLIEVVSGTRFDQYLQEHILKPLDMRDTSFFVPESKRGRLATIYRTGLFGGPLIVIPLGAGSETLHSGGGGLFSTARDYARFAQMLLNGGEFEGSRILKPETIREMTINQIGELNAIGIFKYGLGFGLEMGRGPAGESTLTRYFWGGFFSTNFWVDPRQDVVAVCLTQVLPTNHGGADRVLRRFIDSAIEK